MVAPTLSDRLNALPALGIKVVDPNKIVESEIERRMVGILNSLPGYTRRPVFLTATDWQVVQQSLHDNPFVFKNENLLVFMQLPVLSFRADFMIVARRYSGSRYARHFASFFIECDGKEFHSGVEQIRADVCRNADIERITFCHVMHFSGAEIMFCPSLLSTVIRIYIDALLADGGSEAVKKLREQVQYQTMFRGIRTSYNSKHGEEILEELLAMRAEMQRQLNDEKAADIEDE